MHRFRYECRICGEMSRSKASAEKHAKTHPDINEPPLRRTTVNDLRAVMRRRWMISDERKEAIRLARVRVSWFDEEYGLRRSAVRYECARCAGKFEKRDVEVDHVVPVGAIEPDDFHRSFGEWCDRLFCVPGDLQVLCKPCHHALTEERG